MNSHPINMTLRFVLELAALLALGIWGWQKGDGLLRFVLAFGVPLVAAFLWAAFRVPGDPGAAPVAIPGTLRLAFELVLFAFATWAFYDTNLKALAGIFRHVGGNTLHYLI